MKKCLLFFCILAFGPSFSSPPAGVPDPDSTKIGHPALLINEFTKQNITWNWLNRFSYADTAFHNLHFRVRDYFQRNLIIPGAENKQWRDEHRLDLQVRYNRPYFSPGFYINNWQQTDQKSSVRNQFANQAIGLFIKSKWISPYLGYQKSQNRSLNEWGWDAGLSSSLRDYQISNYSASLDALSNYDFYKNRQNYENSIRTSIQAEFNQFSGDSLSFSYSEVNKEFYTSGKLEQVKIFNRSWRNSLYYMLSVKDIFSIQTLIQSRDNSYFNGRNIFYFENKFKYMHVGKNVFFAFHLRTNDETQDNAGIETDSRSRQTAMRSEFEYRLSARQKFNFDIAYVKLQYDTPDDQVNFDDRDEQRYVINLDYYYRFNPFLVLTVKTYAFLFHQMYLNKEQSINNSWNRIYTLQPHIDYQAGRMRNSLSTEVLANYTVYDFENLLRQTRSYVFRKYTFADSLTIRVLGRNHLGGYIKVEREDKGSFFESDFKQQLLQSYKSEFYNFFLLNDRFFYTQVSAGYTFYTRREWRYLPTKKRYRTIQNQGPFVSILYNASPYLSFRANAALSYLDDSAYKKSRYTTGTIRLNYLF